MNLSKTTKVLIVLSALWEIMLLTYMSTMWEENYIFESGIAHFVILSLPMWLYWAGVWIFGDGYIVRFKNMLFNFLKSRSFIKLIVNLLKSFFILFVLGSVIFAGSLLADKKQHRRFIISEEAKNIGLDYSVYYGGFIWIDHYCQKNGYKPKFIENFNTKYSRQVKNMIEKVKATKFDAVGRNLLDIKKFNDFANKKALEGFNLVRKFLIVEKLQSMGNSDAPRIFGNLNNDDIALTKYNNLVSVVDTCKYFDDTEEVIFNSSDVQAILHKYDY